MPHDSKHWPQLADFGALNGVITDLSARGLETKQTLPPPPPPKPSKALLKQQQELEEREARLAAQEEERKRQAAGAAQAEFAGRETARLQGQFRSPGGQGGRRTGLRI